MNKLYNPRIYKANRLHNTDLHMSVLWFERKLQQYKKHKISKNESYKTPLYNKHRKQYRVIKLISIYNESYQSMKNRIR